MKKKTSEIFEGHNSSLRKAYDNAVKNETDEALVEIMGLVDLSEYTDAGIKLFTANIRDILSRSHAAGLAAGQREAKEKVYKMLHDAMMDKFVVKKSDFHALVDFVDPQSHE